MKIVKLPYLSEKSSHFDEIWYTASDIEPNYSHVTKKLQFLKFEMATVAILKIAFLADIRNPRWRTAAILKIAKSPYLSEKSSDFDKIWYTKADIEPDDSHVTKIENFKMKMDAAALAELKQQKSKRLTLLRSTLTLWQCPAKVISAFLIFAVLVLRDNHCRPYTPF